MLILQMNDQYQAQWPEDATTIISQQIDKGTRWVVVS